MAAEEFVPPGQPESTKSCGGNITGTKKTNSQYIAYAGTDDTDYPDDACSRLVHGNAQIDDLTINNDLDVTGNIVAAEVTASGVTLTSRKAFDIPHPTKDGYRLRHICLEGPESAVYIRGRLTDSSTIEVPGYWDGLVDPETITVQLTQIGCSQDLIVDKIEWGKKIKIRSGNASKIDCYYYIQGERKDGEKLIVEYEGTTIEDYPGDNSQYTHNK